MADTMTSQNIDLSSWDTLYNFAVSPSYLENLYASVRYANIFLPFLLVPY